MYAKICDDISTCAKNVVMSQVKDVQRSGFEKARTINNDLSLIIDHDEEACEKKYKGQCYYLILVQGNSMLDTDFTKYNLNVVSKQQNYYVL